MSELHIIFAGEDVMISKKPYTSWREIQDEYEGYMASLGPWKVATVVSWLDEEYSDLVPSAQEQVEALLSSEEMARSLSFTNKNEMER
jgi:hypothetical protein